MRALLLAAGFGTRLRPLTNAIPKCLVPIKGVPLLEIWLQRLSEAGHGPFLVNTHYLSEQVQKFVASSPYREQVAVVHEKELLGTAGTLLANLDFFEDQDGFLIHADNYCEADVHSFALAHLNRPPGCVMTMMTFRTDKPSACGIVELDERGVVAGFHEKTVAPPGNIANGAVYIISSQLMHELQRDFHGVADFSTQILPHLVGRIYTYETTEVFADVGTPESYARLNA